MNVLGVGVALGETSVANPALSHVFPEAVILQKTGIAARRRTRYSTATLAARALQDALTDAGLGPGELAAVLLSTNSGDQWVPPTSTDLARRLGLSCAVMDVNAACAGSLYALRLASGLQGPVAVVAAETVSRFCAGGPGDWCAAIFGDGAGAVVVEAPFSFLGTVWGTAPEGWEWMTVLPPAQVGQMDGRKLFEAAVSLCVEALEDACRQASVAPGGLDVIVPHQANLRLLEAVAARLGVPMERVVTTVQETGNLSSASLLVALALALRHHAAAGAFVGCLRMGLVAFGAGLTYGAAVCDVEYASASQVIDEDITAAEVDACERRELARLAREQVVCPEARQLDPIAGDATDRAHERPAADVRGFGSGGRGGIRVQHDEQPLDRRALVVGGPPLDHDVPLPAFDDHPREAVRREQQDNQYGPGDGRVHRALLGDAR